MYIPIYLFIEDSTDPIKVSVKQGKEFLFNHNLGTYTMKSNPRYNNCLALTFVIYNQIIKLYNFVV